MTPETTPVIFAIGEVIEKDIPPQEASDPIGLIVRAMKAAEADCGLGLTNKLSSIDVINISSFRRADMEAELGKRLGTSAEITERPTGGQTPILALCEFAERIRSGEDGVFAVVGAEAQKSLRDAAKAGMQLDWGEKSKAPPDFMKLLTEVSPQTAQSGLLIPANAYPLYENAQTHYFGSPREAHRSNAALWTKYSEVAAENPFGWQDEVRSAEQIAEVSNGNRIIAWPYTKSMVANPNVNQGAAVLITSLTKVQNLGISENKLIYIGHGAMANEPTDILARTNYTSCPSMETVLLEMSGSYDMLELYSCFPIVPQMIRRAQADLAALPPTVTGGLSFFGAPLNTYMTHALCAMTRKLRSNGGTGLAYGLGEFLTKHCVVELSSHEIDGSFVDLTEKAKNKHINAPNLDNTFEGEVILETFTVIFDRQGQPERSICVVLSKDGTTRSLTTLKPDDKAGLETLLSETQSPIGQTGKVTIDGRSSYFSFNSA